MTFNDPNARFDKLLSAMLAGGPPSSAKETIIR